MSFQPLLINNVLMGYQAEKPQYKVVFGTKPLDIETLKNYFSNYKFSKLKQIHSDVIIETQNDFPADAHWTSQSNLGLLIQTADCLPVMIYDSHSSKICAIHAGWRGIAQRILPKAIESICTTQSKLEIFIGPCIHKESFEIDKDVFDQLCKSAKNAERHGSYNSQKNKYHFDLVETANLQIQETLIPFTLKVLSHDTFKNPSFSSFRREKGPCRNWSFILKSK